MNNSISQTQADRQCCPNCGDPPTGTEPCRACVAAMVLVLLENSERLIGFDNLPRAASELESALMFITRRLDAEAGE